VPVGLLVLAEMPAQAGSQAPGSPGAAGIAVEPRLEAVRSKLRHAQVCLAVHVEDENVGPGRFFHAFSRGQVSTLL
jgi:hypothetical protein